MTLVQFRKASLGRSGFKPFLRLWLQNVKTVFDATVKAFQASAPPLAPTPASTAPVATSATAAPTPVPVPAPAPAHAPAPAPVTESAHVASSTTASESDVYGLAASNLVAGSNLEGTIQQILDMSGGTWDRDTLVRALRAAYNNPERAVEYLYSGIPEQPEAPPVAHAPVARQTASPLAQPQQPAQATAIPASGPNANPLDLFPQGLPNMGAMVQANLQILQLDVEYNVWFLVSVSMQ
ncbi:hypothetical protein REPUB_Repub06bG0157800 [Reevesia pubescens]